MSNAAMFTAVSGSSAQQVRIDVIANNLANIGTVGFKRLRPQFEDLLYETVRRGAAEGDTPTGLQFGRGVRVVSTEHNHGPGSLRTTEGSLDVAIEGAGFLAFRLLNGDVGYSRNGELKVDADLNIVNSAGLPLDPPITLPPDTPGITITPDGRVRVTQPGAAAPTEVGQIQLTRFPNPSGLEALGGNLFAETEGSGTPTAGSPGDDAFGNIQQGVLEEANVNIAEELGNLIVAQRAFEANTRVISASDDMLRFVTQG